MKRALATAAALALVAGVVAGSVASCSLGQGSGKVSSEKLFAHECWGQADGGAGTDDAYDLQPDFFAANPYRSTLQIRVQRGTDIQEVSDGITVLIDDVPKIRAALDQARRHEDAGVPFGANPTACAPDGGFADALGPHPNGTATFAVSLPPGVIPPGSPAVPPEDLLDNPPIVHMALYLHRSCHNQNTVLYAVSGTITFTALFDGDPNESSAAEKLIEVTSFDVHVGDLRDVPLGSYPRDIPCNLQTNVHGYFRFYFDRGQPAQPFP